MTETGEGVEFRVVDGRIGGDLGVVGYVAVGELAAYDVGVLGEGCVGGGDDFDVVGDAGVVVTFLFVSIYFRVILVGEERETYIITGMGLLSATALNHSIIPA